MAEHCCHLSDLFERKAAVHTALWALLHDASEAYLVDLPRPLKDRLPDYKVHEKRVMDCVVEHFGLSTPEPEAVRIADKVILRDEFDQNMRPGCWAPPWEGLGVQLKLWHPRRAEQEFLHRFHDLNERRSETWQNTKTV